MYVYLLPTPRLRARQEEEEEAGRRPPRPCSVCSSSSYCLVASADAASSVSLTMASAFSMKNSRLKSST